ncbi:MAG: PAS domain S-box protein [Candidatus Thorarchaeota archaeon]|jgi:PAS domain S-box-containing protein
MAVEKDETTWQSKIMEIVNDGIVVLIEEDVMLSNTAFAAMLNYDPEELEDSSFEDLLHPSTKRFDRKMIDALYSGEDLTKFNSRLQSKEGDTVHVEIHPVTVMFEGEQAVLACIRDVSRRIALETEVIELEQRFASLYDMSPIAYFMLNRQGVIEQINQAAEEFLGCDGSDILGRALSDFLPEADSDYNPGQELLREVLRGKNVSGIEIEMIRPDERAIWANVSSRSLSAGAEKPAEIGLMAFDVTQRRASELRILEEKERADLYLGIMASDLNNINTSALYSMEFLSTTLDLPEHHQGVLNEVVWGIKRASRMIANMRAIIMLKESPPSILKTDLFPHFTRGMREADRDFESKSLKVNTNIEDDAFEVYGHAWLWSVFFVILHNALMYDERNEVELDVNAELIEMGQRIRVEFADRGPGIPDGMKESIFRRTGSTEGQALSSGLGLTVVNQMITDLNGQVWVEDRVAGDMSQGSKFVIILPAWKEELELPCGRDSCITFFKSDHCVFCGPAYDNMMRVLDELGVNPAMVQVLNVDDPDSRVTEADLIALPTIRICEEEREGYVEEDDIRTLVLQMIMKGCFA